MIHYIYCQPIFNLILLTLILIVCYSVLNSNINKFKTVINFAVLLGSIFLIFFTTLLNRSGDNHDIELRPFYTFILAQSQVEYYRTFFMNALLFVPLGLCMPHVLSKKPHKRNVFITIAFAVVLSAGIEFLQYYCDLGRCETDDVIANTLGAAIGTLSYCLYMRILKNQEKGSLMQNKIDNNQKLLLDLCAKSLFDKDFTVPDEYDIQAIIEESKNQTVFSIVYSLIKDKCDKDVNKLFSQIIAKNIRVEFGHNEVHRVFSKNNISYVVLKGVASASYYSEPMLRTMGDIDILVSPDDIIKADSLLKSIGFVTTDDINGDEMHIGYKRKDGISCELHRRIGWAPKNEVGETVLKYLSDILKQGIEHKTSNGSCIIPDKFYHGIILLLHTATHLTHEGVGLRHLCDWAVFVNGFSSDEFISTFEKPLKEIGLWRFAQLLTLCCERYLSISAQNWTGVSNDDLIDSIVADVLNGGNFGNKNISRYSQIKYISNRKNGETAKKSPVLQLFISIDAKTKKNYDFVKRFKLLLPIGWLLTICKYFYMVIVGKRRIDTLSTINDAKQRKDIYSEFKLFEK